VFESIGVPELLVILVLAAVLFGGKKIPELGKGLGEGIRNFRSSIKGDSTAADEAHSTEPALKAQPAIESGRAV
jgi:sec-independent protein translocase protein TatA